MRDSHRVLVATLAVALLGAVAPAAAQDVVLTRASGGDLQARWTGEEPTEFVLVTATVDREGNVLERTEGRTIVLKPGEDIGVPAREIVPGGGVAYDAFEAVRDPRPYAPGRDGLPGGKYFLLYEDELDTPKEPDVGERGVMPGDNVKADGGERGVGINPGRADRKRRVGIDPGRGVEKRGVGINPGRFVVVTLVPADASAREVRVQPVILHGAAPDDKPDW